ncbi:hypothetical protein PN498_25185 [Oscillatoria sp. CS-180]|uniref:DUF7219 family protein n=1 Tax=Oscillatoria sp. CS-180 TaxID=3021720 RepID=UPI00232AAA11|nr:hypothetical protein [Oscillatoria sp. CS-180]MDB9529311.1 hypothetical protein [Oscillatoria sp. CS-180]
MDQPLQCFLYPRSRYYGQVKPEQLIFNANLQEFALRVEYISGLHTGGRLSSNDALNQIDQLWHQLERSRQQLRIGISEGGG